jgi:hypothetical protein
MHLQASNEQKTMTSTEESEARNQFQIRSDQAIAEGWRYNEDPPEPKKCEYCGKTLYHYGLANPLQHPASSSQESQMREKEQRVTRSQDLSEHEDLAVNRQK